MYKAHVSANFTAGKTQKPAKVIWGLLTSSLLAVEALPCCACVPEGLLLCTSTLSPSSPALSLLV